MLEKPFQGLNPGNEVWNLAGRKEKVVLVGGKGARHGTALHSKFPSQAREACSLNWIMLLNHTPSSRGPWNWGDSPRVLVTLNIGVLVGECLVQLHKSGRTA